MAIVLSQSVSQTIRCSSGLVKRAFSPAFFSNHVCQTPTNVTGRTRRLSSAQLSPQVIQDEYQSTPPADVPRGVLLGIGNPLLDITVHTDEDFLERHGLRANDEILASPRHVRLFNEIMQDLKPRYVPGGAAQNTIRVAQWLLQTPKSTGFIGCVGNDDRAAILRDESERIGVKVSYQTEDREGTGVCAAIITGAERSLVTHLGAAGFLTHDYLRNPESRKMIEAAQVYYICGFLFPVGAETIISISRHAAAESKQLVMNLSSPMLCHYFSDPKIDILPYIDVLVGNSYEAMQLNEGLGTNLTDISDIARYVSLLPKANKSRKRTVIITRGRKPTVIAHDGEVSSFDIAQIDNMNIKDTNGCGDAYMGGYLSQLVQGKSIDDCVRCAKYSAKTIIQQYGCTYPDRPAFQ